MMTRDIGFAIRDFLEGFTISKFEDDEEIESAARVDHIDVSDADNPVVHLDTGHTFQIRIFAA